MKNLILIISCFLLLVTSCKPALVVNSGDVILVRHAERDDGQKVLNDKGKERANRLANILREAGIEAIFSSDYQRTKQTAQPLCELLNLEPIIYDAGNLPALVTLIKKDYSGKKILVVGHSNTIPETINAFGITPTLVSLDHHEYSNLYILKYGVDNEVILLKY